MEWRSVNLHEQPMSCSDVAQVVTVARDGRFAVQSARVSRETALCNIYSRPVPYSVFAFGDTGIATPGQPSLVILSPDHLCAPLMGSSMISE
jgi:hypothetical protein